MSGDDDVPSCWICLDDGPDQFGKPPIRDCSCRGDAGYAHLSCIIQYAQRASLELNTDRLLGSNSDCEVIKFTVPWEKCSICHQKYQHELAVELANSLLLFIEENYPQMSSSLDQLRFCDASRIKINAIRTIDCLKNPHWRARERKLRRKYRTWLNGSKVTTDLRSWEHFLKHMHTGTLDILTD